MSSVLFDDLFEMKAADAAELEKILGSNQFHQSLLILTPKVAAFAQEEINKLEIKDSSLKEYLNEITGDQGICIQLVEVLIPRIIINVEKHRLASLSKNHVEEDPSVDPAVKIILHLIKFINRHFEDIQTNIQKIDVNLNEEERKKTIRSIFSPLANELLTIAFPNGQNDLPVISILKPTIWELLQNSIFPDAIYDLYTKLDDLDLNNQEIDDSQQALKNKLIELSSKLVKQFFSKNRRSL